MAPGKNADDFNAIIKAGPIPLESSSSGRPSKLTRADRERRKNEALAQQIFGKGRRSSAPRAGAGIRKTGTGPSLASRVGISKRNASTNTRPAPRASRPSAGNVDDEWTHDLHSLNDPAALRAPRNMTRTERLYAAFSDGPASKVLNEQVNIVKSIPSKAFAIRGLAGPYAVIAKNFAHGTTAADIESAMVQIGGVILDCHLLSERPSVVAELTFETKEGADAVVATFDKQNADGNILHVYHRPSAVISTSIQPSTGSATHSKTPRGPKAESSNDRTADSRRSTTSRYGNGRQDVKRDGVIDGSYGFEDRMDTDDQDGQAQGLYSDDLVSARKSRGRGNATSAGRNYYRGRERR